jgi:hypothetical protein
LFPIEKIKDMIPRNTQGSMAAFGPGDSYIMRMNMEIKNSENLNEQSMIKTGLLAIFAGILIGIFDICYEWSWGNFLSGIVAGIGFTITFFVSTVVFKFSKNGWRLYLHCVIAGLVAGFMWWLVTKTHNVITPVIIGGIGAPLAMWLETRNYNKKTT